MRIHLTRLLALGLTALVVSCSSPSSPAPSNPPPSSPTLSGIAVTPAAVTLAIGATQAVAVTATYSDSSTVVVTDAVWTTSDATKATVSAGTITAVAAGTATITASKGGKTASVVVTINPAPATLVALTLDPSKATLAIGATQTVSVGATMSDGSSIAVTDAVWASSNNAVATVSSGTITAVAAGTSTITATKGGKSDSLVVTVLAADVVLTSLQVNSSTATLKVGSTEDLFLAGTYSDASTGLVTDAVWTTADAGIATVVAGTITAVAPGSTVVTATKSGQSVSVDVTVLAADVLLTSITASPASLALLVGASQDISVAAAYSNGSTGAITDAEFASSDITIASVSNGTVVAVKAGTATITVTKDGKTATVTVVVSNAGTIGVSYENPVLQTISITGPATLSQAGASGTYAAAYSGSGGTYQWFIDGHAVSGATTNSLTLDPNTLNPATHLITVVVADPSGVKYSSNLNVKVTL